MVLAWVLLSSWTPAWQLYVGMVFMAVVMGAPGGLASLGVAQWHMVRAGLWGRLVGAYAALACTGAVAMAGLAATVEMLYHVQLRATEGTAVPFGAWTLQTDSGACWFGAVGVAITGGGVFFLVARQCARKYAAVYAEMELARIKRQSP